MNIVALDAYTLNPGDLTWNELQALGQCTIYERTDESELLVRAGDAEILLINKVRVTGAHIERLPRLRYIGVLATGTNSVDLQTARKRGVIVTNAPGYSATSVAQATIALLLELTHGVGHHARTVRDGRWTTNPDWCYWDQPLVELAGLTLGIVGLGSIGQAVAGLGAAFGMNVLARVPSPRPVPAQVRLTDLESIFRQSDVLSLHCPLTPQTERLVNAERLSWMRPTAFLLNTSRGPLVDEQALSEALNSGRLAGAGLDVLSQEPPLATNPLLTARNCLITPHFAWGTRAARARLMDLVVGNIRAFLNGQPRNVVN